MIASRADLLFCLLFESFSCISCYRASYTTGILSVSKSCNFFTPEYLSGRSFSKHREYEFQIIHMISEIFLFDSFEFFVLLCSHTKSCTIDLVSEYRVFESLFDTSFFPFTRERVSYCYPSLSLIYP